MTDWDGTPRDPHWIGQQGERIAASWLRAQGCKILSRNYRAIRGGEVDIIARDGKLLLFIEVKTRTAGQRIRPLDAVNHDKQQLIERGVQHWLSRLGNSRPPWRCDVCEVILEDGCKPKVTLIRNAF